MERPRPAIGRGRHVVVGEMCPQGAGGRPAIAPLVMRAVSWNDTATELANVVERGSVPRWVVFGVDGKTAGLFDTLGLADVGMQQSVAAGTYVGAGSCTADAGNGQRTQDATCATATSGCGLAVGALARADDPPETFVFKTGGACLQGDSLAVDIDGDKVMEQFPLAGILDGARSPAAEWTAAPVIGGTCTPTFALYNVRLSPAPDANKAIEAKHVVKLTVLGVVDLDDDGRQELVIAFEFPTVRTIAVYTASGAPQRLELAGEAQSFPR